MTNDGEPAASAVSPDMTPYHDLQGCAVVVACAIEATNDAPARRIQDGLVRCSRAAAQAELGTKEPLTTEQVRGAAEQLVRTNAVDPAKAYNALRAVVEPQRVRVLSAMDPGITDVIREIQSSTADLPLIRMGAAVDAMEQEFQRRPSMAGPERVAIACRALADRGLSVERHSGEMRLLNCAAVVGYRTLPADQIPDTVKAILSAADSHAGDALLTEVRHRANDIGRNQHERLVREAVASSSPLYATALPVHEILAHGCRQDPAPDFRGRAIFIADGQWSSATMDAAQFQSKSWRVASDDGEYSQDQAALIDQVRRSIPDLDSARDKTIARIVAEDWETASRTLRDGPGRHYVRVTAPDGSFQQGMVEDPSSADRRQFLKRTGNWVTCDVEGRIRETSQWTGGRRHGEARRYSADGRLRERLEFREGIIQGDVFRYDERGNIVERLTYDNGALRDARSYQPAASYRLCQVSAPVRPTRDQERLLEQRVARQRDRDVAGGRPRSFRDKDDETGRGRYPVSSTSRVSDGPGPPIAPNPLDVQRREALRGRFDRVCAALDPDFLTPPVASASSALRGLGLSFRKEAGVWIIKDEHNGCAYPLREVIADQTRLRRFEQNLDQSQPQRRPDQGQERPR